MRVVWYAVSSWPDLQCNRGGWGNFLFGTLVLSENFTENFSVTC